MLNVFSRLGASTWITSAIILALTILLPATLNLFTILQLTVFVVMGVLALSLALSWGLGGILCFGQAAFFGLGGYTYAIAVINFGESTVPVLLAIVVPALFALVLGWFMFMGRLSELYVGVITLCVSLILYNFINSTSDPWFRIGEAKINGFNGMSAVPTLNIPFSPNAWLTPNQMFVLVMVSLLLVYLMCKFVAASSWGRVVAATRQNEVRAELLGYDTARIKLGIFVLGSAVAGYAGCLFTNWNAFISPNVFSLSMSAQIIIWMIVGGRETFVGPVIGAIALQYLTTRLGNSALNANVALGAILMLFVVLVPRGLVPTIGQVLGRWWRSRRNGASQSVIAKGEAR
ncbi:branched-chain amino acid ABC transporter permease [Agrobacterium rosae]|uniref:Branched-chain amino acid ABC transporter permease n=1 Tax=Agrobacterium rosae TaxID=1972867 RepID=A0AAW9FG29_9HYPH|nr:branched-chain amino acid ABC transporter permease [Agrobacterium rosae]MDX8304455.1 branched-chain amino acid ABC transporter permease [Agrobacterium rosae]